MTDIPKEPLPPSPDSSDSPDQPALWEPAPEESSPWGASSARWNEDGLPAAPADQPAPWDAPSARWHETDEPAEQPDEPVSWSEPSGQWDEPSERWDATDEPGSPGDEPEQVAPVEETSRWDEEAETVAVQGEAAEPAPWHEAYEPAAVAPEVPEEPAVVAAEAQESEAVTPIPAEIEKRKRISGAGVVIGVLLALLGFALVVQVKSNTTDNAYASAREGDLLQIMSDLDGAERRLQQDIASLQATKRELASGAAGQEAAQEAAKARADALGILAGTLQARGPGVEVRIDEVTGTIKAASLLNAVQELRGGGAEAIQIDGTGGAVRVIASTSFVDSDGGIRVDGRRLTGPYTIIAIGDPDTLSDAVQFAGGVVPRVRTDGGNVIVNKRDLVEIKEVRPAPSLEFARPVS